MKRLVGFLILGLAILVIAMQAVIGRGVDQIARTAAVHYPGPSADALLAFVDCEHCSLRERNRAVWALGQMRERRAIEVLRKYQTGKACNHARGICQDEIRKALEAIEGNHVVWLGYRGTPKP